MTYRMLFIGRDTDGRERWRGTGFNIIPGGVTYVGYEQTREWRPFWNGLRK